MKSRKKKARLRQLHRKALAVIRTAPRTSEEGDSYDADRDHAEAIEVMKWVSTI